MGNMTWLWLVLVAVRLGWSLVPQTGYIHPDEFFQTVEVVAGDVLDIDVVRTWEFNKTSPLRSLAIPYLLFAPFYRTLKYLGTVEGNQVSGYTVLAGTRFIMAVLSVWIDVCVYQICKLTNQDHRKALLLIASSYVTLTYQCHSFTNSIETLIFVSLVYVLIHSITKLKGNVSKRSGKHKKGRAVTKAAEKDPKLSLFTCILMGSLPVCGVFNRPTFLIFSAFPLLWWGYQWLAPSRLYLVGLKPLVILPLAASVTTSGFWLFDSMYYNEDCFQSMMHLFQSCFPWADTFPAFGGFKFTPWSSTFTPWNFIKYNTKGGNLAEHGLHPVYLHMLVNLPLLFGPAVFYLLRSCGKSFQRSLSLLHSDLQNESSQASKRVTSPNHVPTEVPYHWFIVVSVLIFSMFPHQEPRFLIPLLPIVILNVVGNTSGKKLGAMFVSIWILFNILLSCVYGSLHQGGVTQALLKIQEMSRNLTSNTDSSTIIFTHTYMPPRHLLLSNTEKLHIMDIKGGDIELLLEMIAKEKTSSVVSSESMSTTVNCGSKPRHSIFIVLPREHYRTVVKNTPDLKLSVLSRFFPHLSMEDPPDLAQVLSGTSLPERANNLLDTLSLYLVKVVMETETGT